MSPRVTFEIVRLALFAFEMAVSLKNHWYFGGGMPTADTRNVASARVLEKLGFVREGTLREDCVVNGEVSDSWVYGLIRREWRPPSEPTRAR